MPPKGKVKKKDEAPNQCQFENNQTPGRRLTRQSISSAVPAIPTATSTTPRSKKKLTLHEIESQLMSDAEEDNSYISSIQSVGKNENISNLKMDDHSITMKIRRMSVDGTYKVVDCNIGLKKVDSTTKSTEPTGRSRRSRNPIYPSLYEKNLWPQVTPERLRSASRKKNDAKRQTNEENEWESMSEGDENTKPNIDLSPKRPKLIDNKSKQIPNTPVKSSASANASNKIKTAVEKTPRKGKSTNAITPKKGKTATAISPKKMKKAIATTPSKLTTPRKHEKLLQTPTKALRNLQIGTPKASRSTRTPLENNKLKQVAPKSYELMTKKSKPLYAEYSSQSESGDDDDKDYDLDDDSPSSEDEDEDYSSDDSEIYSAKRSKSAKCITTSTRTPSKSNLRTPSKVSMETPTKLISGLSLNKLTPSIHRRTMNIVKPSTPLQEARQKLHVSVLPKSLPCREEEFNNIYSFLHSRLSDLSGGCIYVSGVPGTGKTATVNEVIRCLKKSMNAGDLNEFEFVEINGMKLSEPRQAYVQIWKQLSGTQTSWEVAQASLNNRFTTANSKRGMTLLLVDELDLLCTKRQDVVYNLLDWPSKSTAKLVVVTIANTMDLPERILMGKVTSRLGLTRLTFPPYNHKQLEEIVVSRLKGHNAFSGETVQLVARKVAAVSGDARRALDICRRATEVAEMNDREVVTMVDVKTALDEMIASPKIQAIKSCSDLEKVFLQAVCAEVGRTGVEEVLFKNVYFQLEILCAFEGERVPNVTEALSMCARLGAWRLLLCDHSRLDIHQRLLLNVSTDDVQFAIRKVEA